MGRPMKEAPSPSPLVPALLRFVRDGRETGAHDASMLSARFGFAGDVADRDEAPITPTAFGDLVEAVAEIFGEPFLALRIAGALPLRRYGLAELAARSSATVR